MYPIVARQAFSEVTFLWDVLAPDVAKAAQPGHFVMLRLHEGSERIPLTVADFDRERGTITLVIQAVGKTTREMQQNCRVGTHLHAMVGPMGIPSHIGTARKVVCVGGGLGVAPVYPQARAYKESGAYVIGVLGFRNRGLMFWEDKFRAFCDELIVCTDDGSAGVKGMVTEGIRLAVAKHSDIDEVVAIGPPIMMKGCAEATRAHGIKTMVSLNPVMVEFYRVMGYLPEGVINYLGRLGWSLDDKTEIIPLETMRTNFGFDRINSSSASFDPAKMLWVASEYTKVATLDRKIDGVIPVLQRAGLLGETVDRERIGKVVQACGERLKIFADVLSYAAFFFRDPQYDAKAVKQRLHKEGIADALREFAEVLKGTDPFDAPTLEAKLAAFSEGKQLKAGDLNHALRVATTGVMVGPGVFECLGILGRDETLRRIALALALPR